MILDMNQQGKEGKLRADQSGSVYLGSTTCGLKSRHSTLVKEAWQDFLVKVIVLVRNLAKTSGVLTEYCKPYFEPTFSML